MRLVKKGWSKVPARLIYEDGLWQAEINGALEGPKVANPLDSRSVMRVWEAGRMVSQPEYDHAIALKLWAEKNEPTHPAANPRQPIDLTAMNPLWRTE
jgi:hypothetical protein